MGTERRRQIALAVVAVVLAVVAYQAWPRTSAAPGTASNQRSTSQASSSGTTGTNARPSRQAEKQPGGPNAPDVHLEALEAEHPKPSSADRNLFRFKPKAPPPPPPPPRQQQVEMAPQGPPPGPPPPPPPPPITVKFIGLADVAPGKPKIAVLTDGLGAPQIGHEGEVVFGKYRILKIGVESIEMAYLDGRGRQTIRLSGS
jgi:hypothetical protein